MNVSPQTNDGNLHDMTVAEAEELAGRRFFSAATGKPATDEQRELVAALQSDIRALASKIIREVPNGRNQSIALTALEDVQMRANRAIFSPVG